MPTGFGLLFAVFLGLPFWFWIHASDPVSGIGVDLFLSLGLILALAYAFGWVFGAAIRKIKTG